MPVERETSRFPVFFGSSPHRVESAGLQAIGSGLRSAPSRTGDDRPAQPVGRSPAGPSAFARDGLGLPPGFSPQARGVAWNCRPEGPGPDRGVSPCRPSRRCTMRCSRSCRAPARGWTGRHGRALPGLPTDRTQMTWICRGLAVSWRRMSTCRRIRTGPGTAAKDRCGTRHPMQVPRTTQPRGCRMPPCRRMRARSWGTPCAARVRLR